MNVLSYILFFVITHFSEVNTIINGKVVKVSDGDTITILTSDHEHLEQLLYDAVKQKPTKFIWGKRKITLGGHSRTTTTHTKEIVSLHNQITDSLEKFLMPEYSLKKKNISIETMTFGNNIADFVLERPDKGLTIIEIKTSSNVRYNIREALGQLLDYCNWDVELDIYELVVISPSPLSSQMQAYLQRIKEVLKIRLSYWQYCGEKKASEKFRKY